MLGSEFWEDDFSSVLSIVKEFIYSRCGSLHLD